jgi:hypothetical protein
LVIENQASPGFGWTALGKAPELFNPLHINSAPTGNTYFILSEIYETNAGVTDHFQMSQSSWPNFPAIIKWMEKCTVKKLPAAPIINSLWSTGWRARFGVSSSTPVRRVFLAVPLEVAQRP